jgi:Zn-dependent M28 family amino/carboxypeptidase
MPWESLPTCRISREMANAILGYSENDVDSLKAKIEKEMEPQSYELLGVTLTLSQTAESKLVQCHNVLGYIEGSDPELKDEVIVIGAHLDHLGQRGDYIYNGADDNGSGSVGVMECAEAFALNPVKPKRSILFALWTGEEKGLLGSRYYVNHPYFPIEKTVVCLNMDMISRTYTKQQLKMMGNMFGEDIPKEALEKIDAQRFVRPSFSA